jgi:hypothetical protein
MSRTTDQGASAGFVVCIRNDGYPVSLELRKIYEVLPPKELDPPEWIRVVDESGEDYLYPRERFASVELSHDAKALIRMLP